MDINLNLMPAGDDTLLEITAPDEHSDIVTTVDEIKQTSDKFQQTLHDAPCNQDI